MADHVPELPLARVDRLATTTAAAAAPATTTTTTTTTTNDNNSDTHNNDNYTSNPARVDCLPCRPRGGWRLEQGRNRVGTFQKEILRRVV